MRVLVNGMIMAAEFAAVVGAAWLGLHHPQAFAALTAALALALGLVLEYRRLEHELPFYFGKRSSRAALVVPLVAGVNALIRAGVAGLIALVTFSGTDKDRLFLIAIVFAATVYLGSALLRFLAVRLEA
ncbi:MAG: hypothetical protein AB7U49_15820, partial [Hyphomicrobiaceae bacterium]